MKSLHCKSAPTEETKDKCTCLLDYAATHHKATIRYYASDMILRAGMDASFFRKRAVALLDISLRQLATDYPYP